MAVADPSSEPTTDASPAFPDALGERLFVVALVAVPGGLLVGAVAAWSVGAVGGAALGSACFTAVAGYVAAFLRPERPSPAPRPEPGRRCGWCDAAFSTRHPSQRYCAPACRARAAAARRRGAPRA